MVERMEVGKKYSKKNDYCIFTCEAIVSNGDAVMTWLHNDKIRSFTITPSQFYFYEEYKELRTGKIWVTIWKNGERAHYSNDPKTTSWYLTYKKDVLAIKEVDWVEGEGLEYNSSS